MDPDIEKYLCNDTVFAKMNKKFISLDPEDIRDTNKHLGKAYEELITIMKQQDSLFKEAFKDTAWTGSFYKKTKIELCDEFDLNLIIKLPIEVENIKFSTNQPGYTKICTNINRSNSTSNMDKQAYKSIMSFIDDETYLDQKKFYSWIESVLTKAANLKKEIKLPSYDSDILVKKSGPAFTLSLYIPDKKNPISIDLVPVLAFSSDCCPSQYLKNYTPQNCDRKWFVVPKLLNNENVTPLEQTRYWRLSFYEFEKDILSRYGRVKPIIRHLKKFRDTQKWKKNIASYYIETLCFHHLDIFESSSKKSQTFLFFLMLKNLHKAFVNGHINFYWDEDLNLLENIKNPTMKNIENRLSRIISEIEKRIKANPDDPYIIASYVLNENELACLKSDETELEPQSIDGM